MNKLSGHHHISMLTKNGKRNNDFYTKILGLRRVKKNGESGFAINVSLILWRLNRSSRY